MWAFREPSLPLDEVVLVVPYTNRGVIMISCIAVGDVFRFGRLLSFRAHWFGAWFWSVRGLSRLPIKVSSVSNL